MVKTCRWSKREENRLMELVRDEVSWLDISEELQRSIPASKKRFKMLDAARLEKIEKERNKFHETHQWAGDHKGFIPIENNSWDSEKDFDLLVNFYELSIDEAKEKFGLSYGEIASRLEYLVDSTEPAHISMLMEASKAIRSKKIHRSVLANNSPKIQRKLKKIDKLSKKIDKLHLCILEELGEE